MYSQNKSRRISRPGEDQEMVGPRRDKGYGRVLSGQDKIKTEQGRDGTELWTRLGQYHAKIMAKTRQGHTRDWTMVQPAQDGARRMILSGLGSNQAGQGMAARDNQYTVGTG